MDFRNTVIVMTSNLGSHIIQEKTAQDDDYNSIKEAVMKVVSENFRPEFINRIDETVVFHPLNQAQISEIAKIQIARLQKRLFDKEMQLSIDDDALAFLAKAGYDPVFGARPLKRSLQQHLENPLAQDLLKGEFAPGDTIHVRLQNDAIAFAKT